MRVALVYDRVNKIGGAERVLEALHEIWPEAPLYTAVYWPQGAPWAKKFQVIPSFLNKWPLAKKHHELFPWLTPLAFESFDFSEFDLVVSVTSAEAKGIITKPSTFHLCYCLTPTRYLWSGYKNYFYTKSLKWRFAPLVFYLRAWDKVACQRPDKYVAISQEVQQRIKKYYGRDSEIIYPSLDTEKWKIGNWKLEIGNYFLVVSRLVPYKKVDIVVEAFNQLGWPLKIIGVGSEIERLKRMAKPNIQFLGQLTDQELLSYYQDCRALISPQEEDFGLVPLEAQACGKPVIAFKGGGALETVIENKTGTFFYPQTAKALTKTILRYKQVCFWQNKDIKILRKEFKPEDCRANAERFSKEIFKKNFKKEVEKLTK